MWTQDRHQHLRHKDPGVIPDRIRRVSLTCGYNSQRAAHLDERWLQWLTVDEPKRTFRGLSADWVGVRDALS
jgi:hypothetical protein